MDTQRMLEKCQKQQWKIDDLDWSVKPRPMGYDEEVAVRFMNSMNEVNRHPVWSKLFGKVSNRVTGEFP